MKVKLYDHLQYYNMDGEVLLSQSNLGQDSTRLHIWTATFYEYPAKISHKVDSYNIGPWPI